MFDFKKNTKYDIVGMGEVMLRLSPTDKNTISNSNTFEKNVGGAELNVVADAAILGARTAIITKLPDSKIGRFAKNKIRYAGVFDECVVLDNSENKRLGVYYYENGAFPRKSAVEYDRKHSSMCTLTKNEIPEDVLNSTKIFHLSGITPALDKNLCKTCIDILKTLKKNNTIISFDVNYRSTLWSEQEARKTIEYILPMTDILFVSEETSRRMLGRCGDMEDIMRSFADEYDLKMVASTKRRVISSIKHDFDSVIYSGGKIYTQKPYNDIEVVDRIGSGDAYVAGVLWGLLESGSPQRAIELGGALSALKNTIVGDMAVFSVSEVEKVINEHKMQGNTSEMDR